MKFQSILFEHSPKELLKNEPAFFQDLHLHDIMEKVLALSEQDHSLLPYYYTIPDNIEDVYYRQEIYQDISNAEIRHWIGSFCRQMDYVLKCRQLVTQTEEPLVQSAYFLEAALEYERGIEEFMRVSTGKLPNSIGLKNFYSYVSEYWELLQKNGFYKTIQETGNMLSHLTYTVSIQPDKIIMEEENDETGNYLAELKQLLQLDEKYGTEITGVFSDKVNPGVFEEKMLHVLSRIHPEIFQELLHFYETYSTIFAEEIFRFSNEIQFYLSFQIFAEKTEEKGYIFSLPGIKEENIFCGKNIFDAALLWKGKGDVIRNDFSFLPHPSFFVVTGPNQGGKTTFARALGQAVYFSIMGLPVNGTAMELPYFSGLSTHFEKEESLLSNAGKLKEEMNRLKPMMKAKEKRQFIILNELFTTATTSDAFSMGKRVMEHFLVRDCYGIYVTHIQELAEESEQIKSLVAQVEEGEEEKRTFQILPMSPQGYGYSDSLVKEFQLHYEDIIRRLS